MRMLQAKLQQIEIDKLAAETAAAYGEKSDVSFGSQIRSYVFQPYQKVLDLRTGVETSNIAGGDGRRHRRLHPGQTARPEARKGRDGRGVAIGIPESNFIQPPDDGPAYLKKKTYEHPHVFPQEPSSAQYRH